MTNVNIFSFGFNPATVGIKQNDSVKWTWTGNNHSTTSDTALWDSLVQSSGFAFTNTFANAGTFPYHCGVHGSMQGSVVVASAANQLPSVTITNPANGSTFAAPWNGLIQASASDNDGSVTNVQFFRDATSLGNDASPPFEVAAGNLPAGSYGLSAVARDNAGGANTSAVVNVSVVTPVPIAITNPERLSASQFRMTYSANAGLRYVVERAAALSTFVGINTNIAASSSVNFTDVTATASQNLYRVGRLPNP